MSPCIVSLAHGDSRPAAMTTTDASPDPVDLLRSLIRFDTSNPPGNERPCLEFVADLLRAAGVEPRFVAQDADRPNLVARLRGRGDSPPLLLYGHVDVVPANPGEWTYP